MIDGLLDIILNTLHVEVNPFYCYFNYIYFVK